MNVKIEDVKIAGERKRHGGHNGSWTGYFNKMTIGQSFKLPSGTDEQNKVIRNVKSSASQWNKNSNMVKIDWRDEGVREGVEGDFAGVRFGPVPGPGAKSTEAAPPATPGDSLE